MAVLQPRESHRHLLAPRAQQRPGAKTRNSLLVGVGHRPFQKAWRPEKRQGFDSGAQDSGLPRDDDGFLGLARLGLGPL